MSRFTRTAGGVAVALIALLAQPGGAIAEQETDTGGEGAVMLHFGWPKGLRSIVRVVSQTVDMNGSYHMTTRVFGKYQLTTRATASGLKIELAALETRVETPEFVDPDNPLRDFISRIANQPQAYVVSRQGRFLRVVGLSSFRKTIYEGIDASFGALPPKELRRVHRYYDPLLTERQIEAATAAGWSALIGRWANRRLMPGRPYKAALTAPIPNMGVDPVALRGAAYLSGRLPCNAVDLAPRCVRLEMRLALSPGESAAAVQAYARSRPPGETEAPIRAVKQTMVVGVICDPATLLLYATQTLTRTQFIHPHGQGPDVLVREDRQVFTYGEPLGTPE